VNFSKEKNMKKPVNDTKIVGSKLNGFKCTAPGVGSGVIVGEEVIDSPTQQYSERRYIVLMTDPLDKYNLNKELCFFESKLVF
jgi:hypothetical protein